MEEFLEIVDKDGRVISIAPRSAIHGNPSMLHKVGACFSLQLKGRNAFTKKSFK